MLGDLPVAVVRRARGDEVDQPARADRPWRMVVASRSDVPFDASYRILRQSIGRGILLGLELLVAGDIIRTVAIAPTFASVGVLAMIVAIRTFLSFSLEVELTGRWPWQARSDLPSSPEVPLGDG